MEAGVHVPVSLVAVRGFWGGGGRFLIFLMLLFCCSFGGFGEFGEMASAFVRRTVGMGALLSPYLNPSTFPMNNTVLPLSQYIKICLPSIIPFLLRRHIYLHPRSHSLSNPPAAPPSPRASNRPYYRRLHRRIPILAGSLPCREANPLRIVCSLLCLW